jgi:hypothetical protein
MEAFTLAKDLGLLLESTVAKTMPDADYQIPDFSEKAVKEVASKMRSSHTKAKENVDKKRAAFGRGQSARIIIANYTPYNLYLTDEYVNTGKEWNDKQVLPSPDVIEPFSCTGIFHAKCNMALKGCSAAMRYNIGKVGLDDNDQDAAAFTFAFECPYKGIGLIGLHTEASAEELVKNVVDKGLGKPKKDAVTISSSEYCDVHFEVKANNQSDPKANHMVIFVEISADVIAKPEEPEEKKEIDPQQTVARYVELTFPDKKDKWNKWKKQLEDIDLDTLEDVLAVGDDVWKDQTLAPLLKTALSEVRKH